MEDNIVEEVVAVEPTQAEREARMYGWVPKEEYRGPESNWRSAEEFLERGKEINGFLRKDMDKLRSELSKKDVELQEIRETVKEFAKFHEETEKRAYERAIKELKREHIEAIREGDDDRALEISDQIDNLKEAQRKPEPKKEPEQPQPVVDPTFISWQKENEWYGKDRVATRAADAIAEELRGENSFLVGKEFLDEVARRVEAELPNRFKGSRRAAPVDTNTGARNTKAKKTYADLPADAKAACDKYVREGLIKSKEQYVTDYFGE